MPMKVATLVRASAEHYHHHQTKLKRLTQHTVLPYRGSPVPAAPLAARGQHLCLKETHWVWVRPTALIKNILIVIFA